MKIQIRQPEPKIGTNFIYIDISEGGSQRTFEYDREHYTLDEAVTNAVNTAIQELKLM